MEEFKQRRSHVRTLWADIMDMWTWVAPSLFDKESKSSPFALSTITMSSVHTNAQEDKVHGRVRNMLMEPCFSKAHQTGLLKFSVVSDWCRELVHLITQWSLENIYIFYRLLRCSLHRCPFLTALFFFSLWLLNGILSWSFPPKGPRCAPEHPQWD